MFLVVGSCLPSRAPGSFLCLESRQFPCFCLCFCLCCHMAPLALLSAVLSWGGWWLYGDHLNNPGQPSHHKILSLHLQNILLKFLFIYLAVPGFRCGMQDLVLWSGIEPRSPALGAWSLNHWINIRFSILYIFEHWNIMLYSWIRMKFCYVEKDLIDIHIK